MKKFLKNHSNNFQKNLQYEKFEKTIVTIFKKKIYSMKKFLKNHSNNFQKNLHYEKFEKTIVTIFKKNLKYGKIFEKPW